MNIFPTAELLAIELRSWFGAIAIPPHNSFDGTRRKRLTPQADS